MATAQLGLLLLPEHMQAAFLARLRLRDLASLANCCKALRQLLSQQSEAVRAAAAQDPAYTCLAGKPAVSTFAVTSSLTLHAIQC